ncbi:VOC family protein [Emcibacter sp. SYSU 3D8]|uniref:VOC family protein n=1 Tax=Emcibacter sp. SYSU 3D8 TaxID=3133969 RepID=UPI0031FE9BE8
MPSLTHIALHCEDLDASIAFYRDYCGLHISHDRADDHGRVVWMAEPGKEHQFVIVMISGGKPHQQAEGDFSHLGFAMESRKAVDAIAARAEAEGLLAWPPRDEAYPVGYYCGIRAPDGNVVEFSYDQPLGPGAGQSMTAHADA